VASEPCARSQVKAGVAARFAPAQNQFTPSVELMMRACRPTAT